MHAHEFDTHRFHANTWVMYQGERKYVIAVSFDERLLALTDGKADHPADEWLWVRCENATLITPQVLAFPGTSPVAAGKLIPINEEH